MSGARPEPGPLAEEAARLVEAAMDWARRAASAIDPAGDRLGTGAPECTACPFCRAVAAVRTEHPETAERLSAMAAEAAVTVAGVLRTLFDGHAQEPPPAEREPGVEHIDLS
jgi:hypothetical protein